MISFNIRATQIKQKIIAKVASSLESKALEFSPKGHQDRSGSNSDYNRKFGEGDYDKAR